MVLSAGNIHANHQAGLLFIDFETGSTLQISGLSPLSMLFLSLLSHVSIHDTGACFACMHVCGRLAQGGTNTLR